MTVFTAELQRAANVFDFCLVIGEKNGKVLSINLSVTNWLPCLALRCFAYNNCSWISSDATSLVVSDISCLELVSSSEFRSATVYFLEKILNRVNCSTRWTTSASSFCSPGGGAPLSVDIDSSSSLSSPRRSLIAFDIMDLSSHVTHNLSRAVSFLVIPIIPLVTLHSLLILSVPWSIGIRLNCPPIFPHYKVSCHKRCIHPRSRFLQGLLFSIVYRSPSCTFDMILIMFSTMVAFFLGHACATSNHSPFVLW